MPEELELEIDGQESENQESQPKSPSPADDKELKTALAKEREKAEAYKRKLAEIEKKLKAVDIEEYKQLQEQQRKAQEEALKKEQQWEALKLTITKNHQAELMNATKERDTFRERLNNTILESAVTEAFFEAGGKRAEGSGNVKSYAQMLLPQIRHRLQVQEDGSVIVVNENGESAYDEKTGAPLNLAGLMESLKSGPTGILFEAPSAPAGGGTTTVYANNRQRVNLDDLNKLPPAERIAKARELGIIKPER